MVGTVVVKRQRPCGPPCADAPGLGLPVSGSSGAEQLRPGGFWRRVPASPAPRQCRERFSNLTPWDGS